MTYQNKALVGRAERSQRRAAAHARAKIERALEAPFPEGTTMSKTADHWQQEMLRHNEAAKEIRDQHKGAPMPSDALRAIQGHLEKFDAAKAQLAVAKNDEWLSEPQYKHNMTGGDHGDLGDEERLAMPYGRHSGPSHKSIKAIADFARGTKAALVADSTGDNLVPAEWGGIITREFAREAVLWARATVRPVTSRTLDIGAVHTAAGSWDVIETMAVPALPDGLAATPADASQIKVWDVNALVKIGRDELADADGALEATIRTALAAKLAEQIDDAVAAGTGDAAKMPLGIAADAAITQGFAATTEATLTADDLVKLTYKVPAWARRNGAFYAHSSVEEAASLLKDGEGRYLWNPATAEGQPATFRGYPWFTVDGLPAMSATGTPAADKSVFFGDLAAAYLIADRQQITVQRLDEAFITEGKVGLLFTARLGGRTIRPKALAHLKL